MAPECRGRRSERGAPPKRSVDSAEARAALAQVAAALARVTGGDGVLGPLRVRGEEAQLPHDALAVAGGAGDSVSERTRSSNELLHSLHSYSKIGMAYSRRASRSSRQITRMLLYSPSPSLTVSMSP